MFSFLCKNGKEFCENNDDMMMIVNLIKFKWNKFI